MKSRFPRILALLLVVLCVLGGCSTPGYEEAKTYTYDEAVQELTSKLTKVTQVEVEAPLDIYDLDTKAVTLADIDTFPITVQGHGDINL